MEEQNILIYFVGTAGSGKSTLTYRFQEWLIRQGYDAITINLDPGAEKLNYVPDIDIREWVKLIDIMDEYDLGPNGAQIVCADMLALKINEVKSVLDEFNSNFTLVDTPGQIELFTFREASNVVVDTLGRDRAIQCFLFDPLIGSTPGGFISLNLLAATVSFRMYLPSLNLLSKVDTIEHKTLKKIMEWSTDLEKLINDSMFDSGKLSDTLNFEILKVMESLSIVKEVVTTSSETGEGMADIYTLCQQEFSAGEDIEVHESR